MASMTTGVLACFVLGLAATPSRAADAARAQLEGAAGSAAAPAPAVPAAAEKAAAPQTHDWCNKNGKIAKFECGQDANVLTLYKTGYKIIESRQRPDLFSVYLESPDGERALLPYVSIHPIGGNRVELQRRWATFQQIDLDTGDTSLSYSYEAGTPYTSGGGYRIEIRGGKLVSSEVDYRHTPVSFDGDRTITINTGGYHSVELMVSPKVIGF